MAVSCAAFPRPREDDHDARVSLLVLPPLSVAEVSSFLLHGFLFPFDFPIQELHNNSDNPHVFGMTASPITGKVEDQMQQGILPLLMLRIMSSFLYYKPVTSRRRDGRDGVAVNAPRSPLPHSPLAGRHVLLPICLPPS